MTPLHNVAYSRQPIDVILEIRFSGDFVPLAATLNIGNACHAKASAEVLEQPTYAHYACGTILTEKT